MVRRLGAAKYIERSAQNQAMRNVKEAFQAVDVFQTRDISNVSLKAFMD
jgi:hypothetical protein